MTIINRHVFLKNAYLQGARGDVLVKALHYKQGGRGFESRWCPWIFSLKSSFRPHYAPGVESTCNRSEYHEYFLRGKGGRCVGLTTLPSSCSDCLDIWGPRLPETLRACPGLYRDCCTFTFTTSLMHGSRRGTAPLILTSMLDGFEW